METDQSAWRESKSRKRAWKHEANHVGDTSDPTGATVWTMPVELEDSKHVEAMFAWNPRFFVGSTHRRRSCSSSFLSMRWYVFISLAHTVLVRCIPYIDGRIRQCVCTIIWILVHVTRDRIVPQEHLPPPNRRVKGLSCNRTRRASRHINQVMQRMVAWLGR